MGGATTDDVYYDSCLTALTPAATVIECPRALRQDRGNSVKLALRVRTPEAFALQGDPSRSRHPPSSKRSPYIVFPAGRDVTWNDLAHSWRIFSPNRYIEMIPAPLRSHISSPKTPNLSPRWSPSLSPRSGNQTWLR
ncbi:hypothetical protein AVEN_17508-1 [Araneus ventricosus]|uniref:Uncharacterized protein n=1 Tax=Araneus ventricosus TaxID=182803 RepID=A0A4Y2LNR0_ARAVE|nr:hypothetical protein AVEN_17508-1 [Araneus ventricosus]